MIVQFPKFPCQFLEVKLTFSHHPRLLWHFKLTSSRHVSVGAPSAFSKLVIFLRMLWPNCRDLDRPYLWTLLINVERGCDRAGSSRSLSDSLPPQQRLLSRRCSSQLKPDWNESSKIGVFLSLKSLEGVWLDVCVCVCQCGQYWKIQYPSVWSEFRP